MPHTRLFPHIALEVINNDGIFGLAIAGAGATIYSSCPGASLRPGLFVDRCMMYQKLLVTAVWRRDNHSRLLGFFLRFLHR